MSALNRLLKDTHVISILQYLNDNKSTGAPVVELQVAIRKTHSFTCQKLRMMRESGIVTRETNGQYRMYKINYNRLKQFESIYNYSNIKFNEKY